MDTIGFTPERVRALERAYRAAVDAGDDEFVFEDRALLTDYAKYILEYPFLHMNLNPGCDCCGVHDCVVGSRLCAECRSEA